MPDVQDAAHDPSATRPRTASILINNFNYGRFVGAAIESALAQTEPAQVIVVDDGSTDDSRAVIGRFGTRVEAIFTANQGQGAAMNAGFARASGDVVFFLDSDDMLAPTVVATVLRRWRTGSVLVQYPLHIIDVDGRRLGIHPDPPSRLAEGDVRDQLLQSGSYGVNVTSGLAFLRTALDTIMPLPVERVRIAADGYLVRAIAFSGLVQRLDEPLAFYRRHGQNDSNVVVAPGGLAEGFRKKIDWTLRELAVTREFAARHGLTPRADLGEDDADYLGYRLFLLLTDEAAGRRIGARRRDLLPRYLVARWRSAWPLARRLMSMAVATTAAVSPAPAATTLLTWLHDPGRRPAWWRSAVARRRHDG